jgi:hypothetical protein
MIRNVSQKKQLLFSLFVALLINAAIFALLNSDLQRLKKLAENPTTLFQKKKSTKLDRIKILDRETLDHMKEKMKRVGIKNGVKNLDQPDLKQNPTRQNSPFNLKQLAFEQPPQKTTPPTQLNTLDSTKMKKSAAPEKTLLLNQKNNSNEESPFYFKYKNQKYIPRSEDQEILKSTAQKNLSIPMNKASSRISNFEIRYERPEGVSEDELNSDEKAYYSFYLRSYKNYFQKIYSNYEKIIIERPALSRAFDQKHILIGKIDYDTNGNIITVRILKSSENDDLHYFFEETLKQLTQPNPPKVFTKNKKEFSIYYQIHIN